MSGGPRLCLHDRVMSRRSERKVVRPPWSVANEIGRLGLLAGDDVGSGRVRDQSPGRRTRKHDGTTDDLLKPPDLTRAPPAELDACQRATAGRLAKRCAVSLSPKRSRWASVLSCEEGNAPCGPQSAVGVYVPGRPLVVAGGGVGRLWVDELKRTESG